MGFYYDLNNPDANLQSDDFLHFDAINKIFSLGENGGGKSSLHVHLPTLNELSQEADTSANRHLEHVISQSDSLEDFQSAFKNKISTDLVSCYGSETLVKHRVEKNLEKNLAVQEMQKNFMPENVVDGLMFDKKIHQNTESAPRKILQIRNINFNGAPLAGQSDALSQHSMSAAELRIVRGLNLRTDKILKQDNFSSLGNEKLEAMMLTMRQDRKAAQYSPDRGK